MKKKVKKFGYGGSMASGAMTGLSAGSMFGPIGMAVGAGAGLGLGYLSEVSKENNELAALDRQANARLAMGGKVAKFPTGGTHEESHLGGIPIRDKGQVVGLVEEGEVKYDYTDDNGEPVSYVFTDRYGEGNKTYAQLASAAQKKYGARIGDKLDEAGLRREMLALQERQEAQRAPMMEYAMVAALGGKLPRKVKKYMDGGLIDQMAEVAPYLLQAGALMGGVGGMVGGMGAAPGGGTPTGNPMDQLATKPRNAYGGKIPKYFKGGKMPSWMADSAIKAQQAKELEDAHYAARAEEEDGMPAEQKMMEDYYAETTPIAHSLRTQSTSPYDYEPRLSDKLGLGRTPAQVEPAAATTPRQFNNLNVGSINYTPKFQMNKPHQFGKQVDPMSGTNLGNPQVAKAEFSFDPSLKAGKKITGGGLQTDTPPATANDKRFNIDPDQATMLAQMAGPMSKFATALDGPEAVALQRVRRPYLDSRPAELLANNQIGNVYNALNYDLRNNVGAGSAQYIQSRMSSAGQQADKVGAAGAGVRHQYDNLNVQYGQQTDQFNAGVQHMEEDRQARENDAAKTWMTNAATDFGSIAGQRRQDQLAYDMQNKTIGSMETANWYIDPKTFKKVFIKGYGGFMSRPKKK